MGACDWVTIDTLDKFVVEAFGLVFLHVGIVL